MAETRRITRALRNEAAASRFNFPTTLPDMSASLALNRPHSMHRSLSIGMFQCFWMLRRHSPSQLTDHGPRPLPGPDFLPQRLSTPPPPLLCRPIIHLLGPTGDLVDSSRFVSCTSLSQRTDEPDIPSLLSQLRIIELHPVVDHAFLVARSPRASTFPHPEYHL